MTEQALLLEVRWEWDGTYLVADAAIGASTIYVEDASAFSVEESLWLGDDPALNWYTVTAVDTNADTISVTPSLVGAFEDGTPVIPDAGGAPSQVWYADCVPQDAVTSIDIPLSHTDLVALPEGTYDPPWKVELSDDLSSIVNVNGRAFTSSPEIVQDVADALSKAEQSLTEAQVAQAIIDGDITYWYQTTAPWPNGDTTHDANYADVWVDTDSSPKTAYRWGIPTNRQWNTIMDGSVVAALFDAQSAQTTADGKIKHFIGTTIANGGTFPNTGPVASGYGDIWTDTARDNLRLFWDGTNWVTLVLGDDGIAAVLIGKKLVMGASETSGERIIIRPDGGSGIFEFFSGLAAETAPGTIDPMAITVGGVSAGGIRITSPNIGYGASYMHVGGGSVFGTPLVQFSGRVQTLSDLQVDGNLTVTGSVTSNLNMASHAITSVTSLSCDSISAGNIKHGSDTITGYSSSSGTDVQIKTITFGTAFSSSPSVVVTWFGGSIAPAEWAMPVLTAVSASGFTVRGRRLSGTTTSIDFHWLATQA